MPLVHPRSLYRCLPASCRDTPASNLEDNFCFSPGGGDVKIESQKLNFKEKAQAKVGSLDNVGHLPAGGAVKVEWPRGHGCRAWVVH